jgi:hypothetical protein
MASPSTYSELVSAVIDMAEDDTTEFGSFLPTAIGLAEDRLFRNLDFDFSNTTTVTTTNGNNEVTKPAGHRVTHNLYVTVAGEKIRLKKKTEDFIYSYWPNSSTTGTPKYYGDKDNSTWILAPTPDSTLTITCEIIKKPTALSGSNATNLFTDYFPDALFYATMSVMCEYMKDPERKAEWEQKYSDSVNTANNEGRRYRQDDDTNNNNLQGGRNTLEKGKA